MLYDDWGDKWHHHFKEEDATQSRAVERGMKKDYPGHGDMSFFMVNCVGLEDPDHDSKMREHKGTHPVTAQQLTQELSGDHIRNKIKCIGE